METPSSEYYRSLADEAIAMRDAQEKRDKRNRPLTPEEEKAERKRAEIELRNRIALQSVELQRQAEEADEMARESLPAEETRTVKDIRREYSDLLRQINMSWSRERMLKDEDRSRILGLLGAERDKLKALRERQDAARKSARRWSWIWPVEENDEVLRLGDLIKAAEREVAYLEEPIVRDDERLANPTTEAERLQREALRDNAEAMAKKYPWLRHGLLDA